MAQDAQAGVTKRIRRRRGGPRTGQSGAALFASGEREQRSRSARRRIGIPSGLYVARALDRAARFRGYPKAVRTDQGPEFTSRALDQWAYANGVTLKLIQAGKPTQNAYIESFNGKFRDECLNEHWFTTLAHARAVIAAWRQDYNEQRPHSALNYLAPSEFAAKHRATADAPAAFQELV